MLVPLDRTLHNRYNRWGVRWELDEIDVKVGIGFRIKESAAFSYEELGLGLGCELLGLGLGLHLLGLGLAQAGLWL